MFKLTTRGKGHPRVRLGAVAAVVAAFAVAPAAATAAVYTVSGNQVAVSETDSTMTGGLSGKWTTTSIDYRFDESTGRLVAWGTEAFSGCLDRLRNDCDPSDPSGTMSFSFVAWQQYGATGLVSGGCIHPVTGATAGFKGAHGVIGMKDTPQADGSVITTYFGVLTIPSGPSIKSTAGAGTRALQASTPRATCGR